jgi:hypothetical protein
MYNRSSRSSKISAKSRTKKAGGEDELVGVARAVGIPGVAGARGAAKSVWQQE